VNVRASEELIAGVPGDVVAVSESGLQSADELVRLRALGYRAFLVGERLMTASDPGKALAELLEVHGTSKVTITKVKKLEVIK
jgi:indole-3-glycerol phosphate synthase